MRYTIDAQGKKLGRVASQAAELLRGKGSVNFTRNAVKDTSVEIINVAKLSLSLKKGKETTFKRYSGYPGGFKSRTVQEFAARRGYRELVRKTVFGMLPKNRMRMVVIKKLIVKG